MRDLDYLKLLAREFPNQEACQSEIINLSAILGLPKGTEYFLSDIHGEDKAFTHLLRSASGIIRDKIELIYGEIMPEQEKSDLARLIYYPEREMRRLKNEGLLSEEWQRLTIHKLIRVCREVSRKYTRSKVRKKMPKGFAYIMDELMQADTSLPDKEVYYHNIVDSIITTGAANNFITALCDLVGKLCIDFLHIMGDMFDRGPRADLVMEEMMNYPALDITWGNHDIDWMGAFCGNESCMATCVRIAMRYNGFDVLQDGYGISLRELSDFAEKVYGNDPCEHFKPRIYDINKCDDVDPELTAKMQKAISIIQFKLEGQLIMKHPEYHMEKRLFLETIDKEKGTVTIEGKEYELLDKNFPTIDPADPYKLTDEERHLVDHLMLSFKHSVLLQKHIRFIYARGAMYHVINNNLLYHGCIPLTDEGDYIPLEYEGVHYTGRKMMDILNEIAIDAYRLPDGDPAKEKAVDFMWYIWCGETSPLFAKDKMATFENYFIADKEARSEKKNTYYRLYEDQELIKKILADFGADPEKGHIISGHVPVKEKAGEHPVKAGGKLFIIDGGLAKSFHSTTGIGGYTLIINSQAISLACHEVFEEGKEQTPKVDVIERFSPRVRVADTDNGKELQRQVSDLTQLLKAYQDGTIKETG